MSGARLLTLAGADIVGDVLGNLFTDCAVGAPVTYAFVQVVNATTGALTGSRTWPVSYTHLTLPTNREV